MEKNIKENVGFYAMGLVFVIIAVLGITANVLYTKTGGYALGGACALIAFIAECFVFALSPKLAKTRTKGMLFFTSFILTVYAILFVLGDLAKLQVYQYSFENGAYVSKLVGLGKFGLVFEIICLVLTILFVARMALNLFGKEIKFYEKLLGTNVVRYKEKDNIEFDLPEKDTLKLVASAERTVNGDDKLIKALASSDLAKGESLDSVQARKKIEASVKPNPIENVRVKQKQDLEQATIISNQAENTANTKQPQSDLQSTVTAKSPQIGSVGDFSDEVIEDAIDEVVFEPQEANSSVSDVQDTIDNNAVVNEVDDVAHFEQQQTQIVFGNQDDEQVQQEYDDNDGFEDEITEFESLGDVLATNSSITDDDDDGDDEGSYNHTIAVDVYSDSSDFGGVLAEGGIDEDVRNHNIFHHITEQVDNDDDDIYSNFDYDD